jgi:hypothetical protein
LPLYTRGETYVGAFATKQAGGFSDGHIASLDAIVAPLARAAGVGALRRIAVNLLGPRLSRQVGRTLSHA